MREITALLLAFALFFTPGRIHSQSQGILNEVKKAKAQNRKEITVRGPFPDYIAAGTLEQVIQKHSALLLKSGRVAPYAAWGSERIVTWHTFTIESRLATAQKIPAPARRLSCSERQRANGLDPSRLRANEIALYFPGGTLPVDGVVVHELGWQRIWTVTTKAAKVGMYQLQDRDKEKPIVLLRGLVSVF